MTPEELREARKIAGGLFAVVDSIVEHYEREAIKMYPKLIRCIDDQEKEIKRLKGLPRAGLYGKYKIQKADGSPVDPEADYFVLRLDTDPAARRAALEYSYYLMREDRELALDLQHRVVVHEKELKGEIKRREAHSAPVLSLGDHLKMSIETLRTKIKHARGNE